MGRRLQPVVAERRLHKSAFVPPGRGLRGSLAPTSCAMLRLSSKETEREREREREREQRERGRDCEIVVKLM